MRYVHSVVRRFFERLEEECFEAGLVWGEELYFDSTNVEANASLDSTRSRSLLENLQNLEKRLKEHLGEIFSEQTSLTQDAHATAIAAVVGPTAEKRRALAQKNARQHRWICKAGRPQRGIVRWGYRRKADLRVSTTDPDASPMQAKRTKAPPGSLPARLPDTLRGGRGQSASNPGCASDSCRGYRKSPHARVVLQEPLPLALAPTLG